MSRRTTANRESGIRPSAGRQSSAALVVAAYAVVGCAWVLLSDVVLRVFLPGRTGELVGSVKGVGFVVATTIVLWAVLATRDHLLARSERGRLAAVGATTAIFASSPLAIVAVDRDGRITAWSPAAERVLGWAAAEVVGHPATILRPDDPAWVSRGFAEVMAGETLVAVPVRYPHRDGRPRDLELFAAPLRDEDGTVRGAVVVAEDVTTAREAQADRARLATAIDQAAEAIVVTDPKGRIVYVNPAFEQVTGYERAELIGENPRLLKSGVHDAAFYERMWGTLAAGMSWRGTLVNRRRDGTLFEEEAAISPVRDASGATTAYVAVKRDLTVERALEADLRAEVLDRLAVREAIGRIRVGPIPEATAASVVEALLRVDGLDYPSVFHLPARPGAVVRLAGRLPGHVVVPGEELPDERAAYLRDRAADGPWVHVFAQEPPPGAVAASIVRVGGITGGIYAPVVHEGRVVAVVGGVTTRPDPAATLGRRLGSLLEVAAFVAPFLGPQLADRDDLAGARSRIAAIVADGAFHPVFQPIVGLAGRAPVGYEALTRFADGVPPDRRFADAASLGCGTPLEEACLRAAIGAARDLPSGAWLSLNASAAMVLSGRLGELLSGADRQVVVEVTEHVAVEDCAALRAAIDDLGGVRLAVDDAGAGFAGFRHVVELRPDIVKLDIGIVRGIDGDPARQSLVAGMVHYARLTGSELVAEGVETEREAAALRALGVGLAQGFLFARPASISDLAADGLAA